MQAWGGHRGRMNEVGSEHQGTQRGAGWGSSEAPPPPSGKEGAASDCSKELRADLA